MRTRIAGALALVLALAGCMQDGVSDKYRDADERFGTSVEGGFADTYTFRVPEGTTTLRVGGAWDVNGGLSAELEDPTGESVKDTASGGSSSQTNDNWFVRSDPQTGNWRLEIAMGGSGEFAFGVYLE